MAESGSAREVREVKRGELLGWLAGIFQEDVADLGIDRPRASIATWDSMGMLLLIAELDDKLALTLSEGELKGLGSIRDLLAVLEHKGVAIVE